MEKYSVSSIMSMLWWMPPCNVIWNADSAICPSASVAPADSIVLFILALAAAFIGTIFAFRAISRIHSGESYTYEAAACAVCVTLIVLALMLR